MGIKCLCPNGHKLNVKSYLAGRRGICPRCGAKVDIPSVRADDTGSSDGGGQSLATTAIDPTAATGSEPSEIPTTTRSPKIPPTDVPSGDPVPESPGVGWHVCPPSGGQFGPATWEVMQKWLAEGRVHADYWVWRDGWSQWKTASQVFPDLGRAPQPPAKPKSTLGTLPTEGIGPPRSVAASSNALPDIDAGHSSPGGVYRPRRRRSKSRETITVVVLAVAFFVLLGVLYFVVVD